MTSIEASNESVVRFWLSGCYPAAHNYNKTLIYEDEVLKSNGASIGVKLKGADIPTITSRRHSATTNRHTVLAKKIAIEQFGEYKSEDLG